MSGASVALRGPRIGRKMKPPRPPERILFVDDEVEVLNSIRRELRGKFHMTTAQSGWEALELMKGEKSFAVVVSDMKMPGMDGVAFLSAAREMEPDSIRIMLTGYADLGSAIASVNEGRIFRFLTKPCKNETLIKAIIEAIKQYRLVKGERALLEDTLQGSLKVLTDLIALLAPAAFSRASRVSHYVAGMARTLEFPDPWKLQTATMLSQIGCLTLPNIILQLVIKGKELKDREQELFLKHPSLTAELISAIPRMEDVSQIIAYQEKLYDGGGAPQDDLAEESIPLGARILKALLDFDTLVSSGLSKGKSLMEMKKRSGWYDPDVLTALEAELGVEAQYDFKDLGIYDLTEGMLLAEDITPKHGGRRLLAKGQQLSPALIMTIRNYNRTVGVAEPIKVVVPL
jgi:response regulator RpfG family c-di-GMP phosphodiesterase